MTTSGMVFAIERSSLHDGPGIRTTVFLKGCPLRCLWCHNPESQSRLPEAYFLYERCITCAKCVEVCPSGCHSLLPDGVHKIDRDPCVRCGECADNCPQTALELKGHTMTVDEVMEVVEKDRDYYEASGGGMTLSGGEPMSQPGFVLALLREAKARGLHTCLETSGFAPLERFREVAELVDLFYYDWKDSDPVSHRRYTGVDSARIRENLEQLNGLGADIVLRCPVIPGINAREDHFAGIAELASGLPQVREIHVLPYHPMGQSKSARLGKEYALPEVGFADETDAAGWREAIQTRTQTPVKAG